MSSARLGETFAILRGQRVLTYPWNQSLSSQRIKKDLTAEDRGVF
jgi:hypothetical protein